MVMDHFAPNKDIKAAEQCKMCRDFCNGALKPRYDGGSPDLVGIPWPRRDLQKRFGYMMPQTVFATRGCRNTCDFCAVVGAKFGWHTRPVEEVAAEIASLPGKRFAFNDVSLCEDREYALALCRASKPLRKILYDTAPPLMKISTDL